MPSSTEEPTQPHGSWTAPGQAPTGTGADASQMGAAPTPATPGNAQNSAGHDASSQGWGPAHSGATGWTNGTDQWGAGPWQAPAQPGIVPLRPLTVGDLFEGTFRAVRANPSVMFGFSVLVMVIVSLASAIFQYLVTPDTPHALTDPNAALSGPDASMSAVIAATIAQEGTQSFIALAAISLASTLLSGLLCLTVADAVLGRVTDATSAWQRLRPRILPLIGITLLVGVLVTLATVVVGLVLFVPAFMMLGDGGMTAIALGVGIILVGCILLFLVAYGLQTKLLFSSIAVVLEEVGPVASLSRSFALTKGAFWRTFGRYLLVGILGSIASAALGGVTGVLTVFLEGFVSPAFLSAFTTFTSGVVSGFIVPLIAGYTTLMYLDERIRKENLAPVLAEAARA